MIRKLLIRRIDDVAVPSIDAYHGRLEIVRHQQMRHRPQIFEGTDMGFNPVGQLLRRRRYREGLAARAHDADPEFHGCLVARLGVCDGGAFARVVNEQLFARAQRLAHDDSQRTAVARKPSTKLTIGHDATFRTGGVFFIQQGHRDANPG